MNNIINAYRPSVAAIIFDKKNRFLLVELVDARKGELDFVKGGMHEGENKIQTLKREILEELGKDFQYQIIGQSHWYLVYDWPLDLQKRKGYIGQARTSFWVKYADGDIEINEGELRSYEWIMEEQLEKRLLISGFPQTLVSNLINEWNLFKKSLPNKL